MRVKTGAISHEAAEAIAFFGAFHGRTMGALSLTASKPQQRRDLLRWCRE